MRQKIVIFLGLGIMLLSLSIALSDCVDLGRASSWYVQGGHSIIFYGGLMPIARVDVPYCTPTIHHRAFASLRAMCVTVTG
jgi:hypothetical protein